MVFSWDGVNREHIAKHGISPWEAEEVVRDAEAPFPATIEEEKLVVWGATQAGRYLQVIYVLKTPDEVSYESLAVEDWMAVEAGEVTEVIRVIHAMDLTARMKRSLRKRRR
jgi:uncharacterized DUF497 family protein